MVFPALDAGDAEDDGWIRLGGRGPGGGRRIDRERQRDDRRRGGDPQPVPVVDQGAPGILRHRGDAVEGEQLAEIRRKARDGLGRRQLGQLQGDRVMEERHAGPADLGEQARGGRPATAGEKISGTRRPALAGPGAPARPPPRAAPDRPR